MKRRLIITAMALWMAVSLTACGENEDTKEDIVVSQENSTEDSSESDIASKESEESKEEVDIQESKEQNVEPTLEKDDKEETTDIEKPTGPDEQYFHLPETQGLEFTSNGDGTCVLVGIGTFEGGDIVIPEKSPAGDVVTEIGKYAFYDVEDIASVVIIGKILKVDDAAFQSCEMERLIISDCELEIGGNAFEYCDDVSEIIIANSDVKIGKYAFYDSGKDAKVTFINCTGTLDDCSVQSASVSSLIISNSTLSIGDNAFEYNDDLEMVLVEDSTIDIGKYAFYDSGDDMQISMKNNVIDMDDNAFQSCDAVSLNIQGQDIELSKEAFEYCKDLKKIVLDGQNLIEIATYAFYGCPEELVITYSGATYNKDTIEDKD